MRMGDIAANKIEVIPSSWTALDIALVVGGYPRGGVVEIYGPESWCCPRRNTETDEVLHRRLGRRRGDSQRTILAENLGPTNTGWIAQVRMARHKGVQCDLVQ